MSSDQFLKRWSQIVDLYSNSSGYDESAYAAIVYDNRLQWRMARGQLSSNLYATALLISHFLIIISQHISDATIFEQLLAVILFQQLVILIHFHRKEIQRLSIAKI